MKKRIVYILLACFGFTGAFAAVELPSTQGSEFYFSFTRAASAREKHFDLVVAAERNGVIKFTDALGVSTTRTFTGGTATTIALASISSSGNSLENNGGNGNPNGSSTMVSVSNPDGGTVITNHINGLTSAYTIAFNVPQNRGYIVETFEVDGITPQKVSIYAGMQGSSTADYANIYPIEALGNEYYILSRPGWYQGPDRYADALVMATEDNTVIEIIPTSLLFGQGANDELFPVVEITLNKGQTYQISPQALENNPGRDDITGTMIRTKKTPGNECKRIAVFSGTQHSRPGDWEYDQLFPVHLWGKEYLSVSPHNHDTRIVAAYPCTEVRINGSLVATLNPSDFISYTGQAYIETSHPVGVAIFTAGDAGDGSMIVLAPVEQRLNSILFTVPSSGATTYDLYITAPTATRNDVQYANNITWTDIPGTNYSKGITWFTPMQTAQITSVGGFNAYIYGRGGGLSYAFSAGSMAKMEIDLSINGYSSNDLATMDCPDLTGTIPFIPTGLDNINYTTVDWEIYEDTDLQLVDGKPTGTTGTKIGGGTGTYEDGGKIDYKFQNIDPLINYAVKMVVNLSGCFTPEGEIWAEFKIAEVEEGTEVEKIICKGASIESDKTIADFIGSTEPFYTWYSEEDPLIPIASSIYTDSNGNGKFDDGEPIVTSNKAIALTDEYGTTKTHTYTTLIGKKYWVRAKQGCKSFIDTIFVTTENIQKIPVVSEVLCKGNVLDNDVLTAYPSEATPANSFDESLRSYAWYKGYTGTINDIIKTGTPLTGDEISGNKGEFYKPTEDYNESNILYYRLTTDGKCAVLEEFDVSIEPIKTKNITTVLCKGSTIKEAVPTNYGAYGATTNSFTGTPTYTWYKDFSGTDINQLIKEPTLTADVDGDNGEFYKPTEDFGKTATYYRLTEAGCAVADVIELTIEDIQSAADQKKTLCYDSSISGTVTDYSTYSTATPTKNNFTATPTYTWYKSFDKATQTGVLADDTNIGQTYKLPDADTYGTTVEYYVLAESGCAVLEKFVVDIEATKLTAETPLTECSGNTLTITPLTDYKPYSDATTPPNDFSGTPTYTWYKNVADLQDPQASEKVGDGANYLIPTSEEAGSEITYVRYSTAGCRVGEPFKVKIFDNVSNSVSVSSPAICADGKEVTITLHQEGGIDKWSYTINGIPGEYLADGTNDAVITFVPEADYRGTPTDYEIVLTSMSLCNGIGVTSSENVLAYHPLEVELYAEGSSLISDGKGDYLMPASGGVVSIIAKAYPEGDYNYTWNNPSFTNSAIQSNHAVDEEETYTVTVTDKAGLCSAAGVAVGDTELKIKVDEPPFVTLLIPGSPTNGTFGLKGMNSGNDLQQVYGGVSYTLTIFNRYGQVIEKLTGEDWDGTYKGKPADAGVYFYVLKYKTTAGNERERKGSVEILRK
jgi:gliding motility-associated-like protein